MLDLPDNPFFDHQFNDNGYFLTKSIILEICLRHQVYICFFISNTVISDSRLKFAKSRANTKEQCEAELLLFGIYSHSSCENNRT